MVLSKRSLIHSNSFQQKLNHICGSFSTNLFEKHKEFKKKINHSDYIHVLRVFTRCAFP